MMQVGDSVEGTPTPERRPAAGSGSSEARSSRRRQQPSSQLALGQPINALGGAIFGAVRRQLDELFEGVAKTAKLPKTGEKRNEHSSDDGAPPDGMSVTPKLLQRALEGTAEA